MKKKLLLIDGNSLMFRAYYATAFSGNLMQNSNGLHTNALYGLANMMKIVLNREFTHILMAFDFGGKTFRHKDLESYKAGRSKMPDEFREQIPFIHEYIKHLGIFTDMIEFIEADDIIGTMAHKYYDKFDEIDIITGDKDLLQLINDKTKVFITRKGVSELEEFDEKYLFKEMHVTPSQIKDLKGLMGDSSDNLKGIPGVGEKTAIKLLDKYNNLETIVEVMSSIKGKLGEKIQTHYEEAILCKQIATIKLDVNLNFQLEHCRYNGVKEEELLEFYRKLEFSKFIKEMSQNHKVEVNIDYETMDDEAINLLKKEKEIFIYVESFNDNYHRSDNLGIAITTKNKNYFIEFMDAINSKAFKELLEDDKIKKMTFDIKRMKVIFNKYDINVVGLSYDMLLVAYVLNPKSTKDEFKTVAQLHGYDDVKYNEEIYLKGAKKRKPEIDLIAKHAISKTIALRELKPELLKQLKINNQTSLYSTIEFPLALILADMEIEGLKVDVDLLDRMGLEFDRKIDFLEQEILKYAEGDLNISSPKQVGDLLFETLGLPIIKKKTKRGYSTSADVLNKLLGAHPVIHLIKKYRELTKLNQTYIVGLKNVLFKDENKVHTIFKQALTETGRLSSLEPNLQNIPIRTEEGRLIRKIFTPTSDDKIFMAADYSQVELRILAHISQTESLIKAFKNGEDIHTTTAKQIYNKSEIDSTLRRNAKAVNFGIIYGMSAYGLGEDIDMTTAEAKIFIAKYLETYPGIKNYMDNTVINALKNGFVETIFGRRRYIEELKSKAYMVREFGKRTAMNAPIQGSAADIIKVAMIKMDIEMKERRLRSKMILQIHDELVFEVEKDEIEIMEMLIKFVMETAVELLVPLTVDVVVGKTWYELK